MDIRGWIAACPLTALDRCNQTFVQTVARPRAAQRDQPVRRVGGDLTSAAGKMTMGVLSAVVEFERDLLIERTQAGLTRAKAEGKALGRPSALTRAQHDSVRAQRAAGVSLGTLAKYYGVSRAATQRVEKRG